MERNGLPLHLHRPTWYSSCPCQILVHLEEDEENSGAIGYLSGLSVKTTMEIPTILVVFLSLGLSCFIILLLIFMIAAMLIQFTSRCDGCGERWV